MFTIRKAGTALAVAGLVGLGVGATQNADAAPTTHSVGMTTVKITKILGASARAGKVDVLLSNGARISMSAANARTAVAKTAHMSPNTTVYGNCGSSYVNLYERSSGHPVKMTTGFHVIHNAVEYNWNVDILGPSYDYEYHSGGGLFFDSSWSGSHTSHKDYPRGIYDAYVLTGSSWALLDTGSVCYSGGPYEARLL